MAGYYRQEAVRDIMRTADKLGRRAVREYSSLEDQPVLEMLLDDARQLFLVAAALERKDDDRALELFFKMDTAARDEMPNEAWHFVHELRS